MRLPHKKENRMKLRRIIAAAAAVSIFGAASAQAAFTDVEGHWAADVINSLADRGVINGVSDNTFNPEGTVTRAEFLKMAMTAVGIQKVSLRKGECLDATASDWYAPYLQSALDKGLIPEDMIAGYSARVESDEDGSTYAHYTGAFNGNLNINREEMSVILQYVYQYTRNALTMQYMSGKSDITFTDGNEISGWAYEAVRLAYANGFIGGMEDGSFAPKDNATRAQAATVINRLIEKSESRGETNE